MKKTTVIGLALLVAETVCGAEKTLSLSVVPQPVRVIQGEGVLELPAKTDLATCVTRLADASLQPEAYRLSVTTNGIAVRHADAAGAFYAMETLRQMAVKKPDGTQSFACCEIEDRPAFRWRGMLFDDGRHFFGKDVLKRTLDTMARYKLNVLHWHLTEDQGWRLDVPGYPELVKYGATRPASPIHGSMLRRNADGIREMDLDGQTYGPYYYTEADVREIVAYAAARHIKVVPEIELPGHVYSALAAYPELACCPENAARRVPRTIWGIEQDVLCIGNDKAIRFMEDVLDYVCRIFPSDIVHIGGDECPQIRWKTCPKCQKRISDEGLGDEKGLQPWITRHFVEFIAKRGKRTLGWDEYLLGKDIPKSAIGMSWRIGKQGAGHDWLSPADLAAMGHDVVMTPNDYCYLDYKQGLEEDPYQYIGGRITLEKCHSLNLFEGVPEGLRGRIIGGQGSNWSEYTWSKFDLEWKMWPRGCALAEVFWCGDAKPPFGDFLRRMRTRREALVRQGVNCAPLMRNREPRIAVFADFVRSISSQRGIPLERSAEMLYDLGVRGFDENVFSKDLDRLAATKLKPISLYYFASFAGADGGAAENARALDIAVRHGVPRIMTIPPNFTKGGDETAEFARIAASLKSFAAAAKARGVTITVEDFGGTENACSHMKYLKRMLDEIPELRFALDSGNLYYAGRGEDIVKMMAHAGSRIAHIHLKDQTVENNRKYASLGMGAVPNEKIVKATWASGYDGWYTLENCIGDIYVDAARQIAVLKAWCAE